MRYVSGWVSGSVSDNHSVIHSFRLEIAIATPSFATLFIFEICFNDGALSGLRDDLNEKFHPLD